MAQEKRVPHCSHWGAYDLVLKGNEIVRVESFTGDPDPSPLIHSVPDWLSSDRRISRPMVRKGWLEKGPQSDGEQRGTDPLVPVDWETALSLVTDEINRVRMTFGNDAIFAGSYGWASCGRFHHPPTLLKRLMNLVGGYTGHVDTYSIAAGPSILRHVLGNADACQGRGSSLDTIVAHTQTLLVFGALSPRTAQIEAGGVGRHLLEGYLRQIAESDIRVILISPQRSDLPSWVDAEWWPIKPNTDTALMLALVTEIIAAGLHDAKFLTECCSGHDVLFAYLTGAEDGVVKNAGWAAKITGLDPRRIRQLACSVAETRSLLSVSWSLQRAHHGEQPFWAAVALAAVAGQIGLPGGGVGFGFGSLGGVGTALAAGTSPKMTEGVKPINRFIPVARIADMLLNPGGNFDYEGQRYAYPDIRLIYWAGGNPFHHHQDLNRLTAAWSKPETIIVQDPMWTATALRADIVLPACTSLERNDIAGNNRSELLVAMHQAVEPIGESRSDFDIFCRLARKLGIEDAFHEGRTEMQWIEHLYEKCRASDPQDLPPFAQFWASGQVSRTTRSAMTLLKDFREDPIAHALATESGRIILGSERLSDLGYNDCLAHPAWLPPAEWLDGKAEALTLFHLISCQPDGRLHSQLDGAAASMAFKHDGRETVTINSKNAVGLGIADGDTVCLWNKRGRCLAEARLSDDIRSGVLSLPTGAWLIFSQEVNRLELSGNPNVLTQDIPTSQYAQGCSAHSCLVSIRRFDEPAPNPFNAYKSALPEAGEQRSDGL